MMSRGFLNTPNVKRPSRIGSRPDLAAVVVIGIVSALVAGFASSEYAAWRLGWNPFFGGWRHLYTPWSLLLWDAKVLAPLSRVFHHPYATYPSSLIDDLNFAWYIAGGTFFSAWVGGVLLSRAIFGAKGNPDDLYDSGSKWATARVAKADSLLDANAGPIIGGFALSARDIRPLRYSGELGISYTEPPGGGKSSFLKTNLLIPLARLPAATSTAQRRVDPWGEEPLIIVSDPKFELLRETSGYQKHVLKKRVLLLAPLGVADDTLTPENHHVACYNPLWSIRVGSDHMFGDCDRLCRAIIDGDGKGSDTHWDRTAAAWGAACIEKLAYRAINKGNPEILSLPGLLDYVSSFSSLDALLKDMLETPDDPLGIYNWHQISSDGKEGLTRVKPSIAQAVREMQNKDVRERAGVYSTFITYLSPYRSEMLRRYTMRSTFDWLDLANDEQQATTVYISMDPMEIPRLRPYLRMVTSNAITQLTSRGTTSLNGRSVRTNFRPTVIALDEVAAWRKLPELEHGSGFFRGYGVYLWLIWQSVAQQKKYYGNERIMDETMDVLMYGRPKTADGAKSISELLGEQTNIITKRNLSGPRYAVVSPHVNEIIDVIKTPLLSTKELMQMDRDKYVAFYNGHNYYLHKWEYFKNASLRDRARIPSGTSDMPSDDLFVPGFLSNFESSLTEVQSTSWKTLIAVRLKWSFSIIDKKRASYARVRRFLISGVPDKQRLIATRIVIRANGVKKVLRSTAGVTEPRQSKAVEASSSPISTIPAAEEAFSEIVGAEITPRKTVKRRQSRN